MKGTAALKVKGKGKAVEEELSEHDSEESDDEVAIPPGQGNVALCFWFPSNQSQQFNLSPQFPHSLQ